MGLSFPMVTIPRNSPLFKKIIGLLLIIVLFSLLGFYFGTRKVSKTSLTAGDLEKLDSPLAEASINRNFEFPIKDLQEEGAKLKFSLVSAKKVKAIANQGKPIQASANEEFLIISLEYRNDTAYSLKATSRDFIRLLGEEDKKYAPDFYNEDNGWN